MARKSMARRLLIAGLALAAAPGCWSTASDADTSRAMNRQMDRMERLGEELARGEPGGVVRSQAPGESRVNAPADSAGQSRVNLAPNAPGETRVTQAAQLAQNPQPIGPPVILSTGATSPSEPAAKVASPVAPITGQAQVRVVANVGNTPIYDSEVREAVNQRLQELLSTPESERKAKERQLYAEELRRIIERELLLDELFAKLKGKNKPPSIIEELKDSAAKEADRRIREFKQRVQVASDDEFKEALQTQGLTLHGLRRQIERTFMMQTYLRELLKPRLESISLGDLRDYYDEHADEFQVDDSVKWQDLFVNAARFPSRVEAKQAADALAERARRGEDFLKLVKEHDHGLGRGTGEGEKRGEIRPLEVESVVFALKPGEVTVVEMETGYHVVRLAERTYAGRRPFDEKTQMDIRRKLLGVVQEREYQRIVETLWRRIQPQVLVSQP